MADKCMRKITDFPQMFKKYKEMEQEELDEWVTPEMLEEIDYAMTRQEGLGIPMFKQDFAYRLVKLNQVENTMWETDFIKKLYKMVKEIEDKDEAAEGSTTLSPKDATNTASAAQLSSANAQTAGNAKNMRNKVNFAPNQK